MAITHTKKRKFDSSVKARLPTKKRSKRQRNYDSGSSDESEAGGKFIARDAPRTKASTKASISSSKSSANVATQSSQGKSILEDDSDIGELSNDEPFSGADSGNDNEQKADAIEAGSDDADEEATDAEEDSIEEDESDSDISDVEMGGAEAIRQTKTKRHDPTAFANSLNAILSSKLPTSKRVDPVLSRSRDAQEAGHELAEGKLEAKAKRKLRDEKRLATEKGRVKDILLGEESLDGEGGMSAADIAEQERRLRKTAQRGVVKLFNAVRAAQVKSEEAARLARQQGVVGEKKREQKVGEMGRNAFLEMVGAGVSES